MVSNVATFPPKIVATTLTVGYLFRLKSFWIGAHYSDEYKCLCVNIVPCFTIWIVQAGGKMPRSEK
jgi:hypothetical protein